MIRQLVIGSIIIAITIAVQAEMFNLLSNRIEPLIRICRRLLRRTA